MRKLQTLLLFLIIGCSAFAQSRQKITNLNNYDYQKIHFGFTIGIRQQVLVNDFVKDFIVDDEILKVESRGDYGFNVGIVSDLRLNKYFNMRFIPSLTFTNRNLYYTFSPGSDQAREVRKSVESALLELPLHLKFRGDRINNSRPFVFAGVKYITDMASEKNVESQKIFKLNRADLALEIGVGCDFYLPFFKFAPQLKYSYGLNNLIVEDGSVFTSPLEGFYSRGLTLSFTFE